MLQILNYKKIIVCLIFALAIFLICFHFTDTPKVWVDEGVFTEVAKNLAWHGTLGLQIEPGKFFPMNNFLLTTSYPVIFPVAFGFDLFGTGIWQARLPMILYMFGLTVLFYLFAKKRYGFYSAILSVLMLLSFSPFYGNGRPVQGEVPGLFFLVLGAWLMFKWEESEFQNKKWAFISGLTLGLSASTKPIFLILIPIALVVSFLIWFRKIQNKKILLFFGLGFVLPVLLWFYIHFPTLKSLLEFIPNLLYFSGNHETQTSLYQTILTNFLKFFKESTPILFLFLFLTIIFSVAYKFYKKENLNISISEFFIFSFIILNLFGFLVGTGWYRYFFPAHVLLYLLFPSVFKKSWFIIPVILIIFQFVHLIFLSDTSFTVKRTRNSDLSVALSQIDQNKKILFYGNIEAIIFLKSDNYSQYLNMGFLKIGDKDALTKPTEDFILASNNQKMENLSLPCYDKKPAGQYFLFQKKKNCE